MSKYFVPDLNPTQVWLPSEYLVAHGQKITFAIRDSVSEADRALEAGERTKFAMPATFFIEGESHSGVVVVTTHRFICCSSVMENLVVISMPYSCSVGIGDGSGLLLKQIRISCESLFVSVKASGEYIRTLRNALLDAIESAPNQVSVTLERPTLIQRSAGDQRRIQKVKDAHSEERRLSKTESAAYGPCPGCKGAALVERHGKVYCMKCGHPIQGAKK